MPGLRYGYRQSNPTRIRDRERPEHTIQSPESRIQYPESRVQSGEPLAGTEAAPKSISQRAPSALLLGPHNNCVSGRCNLSVNLFLIFNTFANLIFNFVSSTASVSITDSPGQIAAPNREEYGMAGGGRGRERGPPDRTGPTPAFIYNFVQLTLAQSFELGALRKTCA